MKTKPLTNLFTELSISKKIVIKIKFKNEDVLYEFLRQLKSVGKITFDRTPLIFEFYNDILSNDFFK